MPSFTTSVFPNASGLGNLGDCPSVRLSGNGGRCNSSYCQCYHSGCEGIFLGEGKCDALLPFCQNLLPTMLEMRYCVTGVLHACAGFALVCCLSVPAALSRKERPNAHALPHRDSGTWSCLWQVWVSFVTLVEGCTVLSKSFFFSNPPPIFTSSRLPTSPGIPNL